MLVYYGGSLYYLVAGILIVAAAILLLRRRRTGAWLYGFALALTIAWSIWEVGFDLWALMPRLLVLSIYGVGLLLLWMQRNLVGNFGLAGQMPLGAAGTIILSTVGSVMVGSLAFILSTELPPDPRFQTGMGVFPAEAEHSHKSDAGEDWPFFGGDLGGTRYTPLDQVTPENVARLEKVWEVDVGHMPLIGASPIKIDDTIYTCNNRNGIFALDASTGAERWYHDASNGFGGTCRGVSYFEAQEENGLCATRIILGNATAQLRALDAQTGELCPDFGEGGIVDLLLGMGDHEGAVVGGYYRVTSAPTIV